MAGKGGARPGAGRPKGSGRHQQVAARLEELNCDPVQGMAQLAMDSIPCPLCKGSGRTSWAEAINYLGLSVRNLQESLDGAGDEKEAEQALLKIQKLLSHELDCIACNGTGRGTVPLKVRGDMYKELIQYIAPKRRAIEVDVGDNLATIAQRILTARDKHPTFATQKGVGGDVIEGTVIEEDFLDID